MATLPEDVLDLTLRLAYEFEWDEVDIYREWARRRFLRNAALVSRAWAGPSAALLGQTIVARQLGDFDAIDWAVEFGALRLERVRTLVLDDSVSRTVDGEEGAWEALEQRVGREVDRTSDAMINRMGSLLWDSTDSALHEFSATALRLARRLTRLVQLRSAFARTLMREPGPWPVTQLAISDIFDKDDEYRNEWPDVALWAELEKWTSLRWLSVLAVSGLDEGLKAVPTSLCARLRALRIGAVDGRSSMFEMRESGVFLAGDYLFSGATPQLRSLDIRLASEHRAWGPAEEDQSRRWPTQLFGHIADPGYVPPVEHFVIGWPCDEFDLAGLPALMDTLPSSVQHVALIVGVRTRTRTQGFFAGFDMLAALAKALRDHRRAIGLVRLELDLAGFGLDRSAWLAHPRWVALRMVCEERGVAVVLASVL